MGDGAKQRPETLAAQALGWIDEQTRALIPPIHLATTYLRDPDNQYRSGRAYSRADNPSYDQAEALLAALEGGAAALTFASGMAAATAVFLALRPGDHVVAPKVMYWGLRKWLLTTAREWGLAVDLVDATDLAAIAGALQPGRTRLLWLETPANPTWVITDIAAAAALAHKAGALVAIDSTVATPVLTRPLALGADIVMHSATKYLNGHSDVVAGALVTARRDAVWERITALRASQGGILGPLEAWLLLRGMRTLFVRVARSCASAQRLAAHFNGHPRVAAVLYPGLSDSPGHAIAARQMQGGFGGMLSIRVAGGEAAAIATAARVAIWKRATSLGGVESLVEHRASIEGPDSPAPPDLLRLSLGLEAVEDLIADLERALAGP
jgi:cystathionine gamma-synthase